MFFPSILKYGEGSENTPPFLGNHSNLWFQEMSLKADGTPEVTCERQSPAGVRGLHVAQPF